MNVRVVDQTGDAVAAGRDLGVLRGELGSEASASFAAMDDRTWNRPDLSEWNFGDLPAQVQVNRGGVILQGYPTLIDRGETVSLQLADTPEKSAALVRQGIRRLFVLKMKKHLKTQVDYLPGLTQLLLHAATLPGGTNGFRLQLAECIADRALYPDNKIPRKQIEFENLLKIAKNRISVAVQEVAQLVKPMLEHYHNIQMPLEGKLLSPQEYAANDLREQLFYLVEEGFLANTPWPWLWQYPRYLRAMKFRLDKLTAGGLLKDKQCHQVIAPLWERYLFCAEEHREREIHDPNLIHYRWMIEELRVSLFAQPLGTGITVSEKRLEDQWQKVQE
jgi:ATP-dependent helicase HrpA